MAGKSDCSLVVVCTQLLLLALRWWLRKMKLGARCPPSGVPTTPRPQKPAPSPRFAVCCSPCIHERFHQVISYVLYTTCQMEAFPMFMCTLGIVHLCYTMMKCMRTCSCALLRYNDLTRPRSLQVDGDAAAQEHRVHTPPVGGSVFCGDSTSGDVQRLYVVV